MTQANRIAQPVKPETRLRSLDAIIASLKQQMIEARTERAEVLHKIYYLKGKVKK